MNDVQRLMSNQQNLLLPHARHLNSINQFLDQIIRSKNLGSIKKLHGHLLTTSLLFLSLSLHTKLIFAYASCTHRYSLPTLRSFLGRMSSTNPLPYNLILSDFCRNGYPFLALYTCSFMHSSSIPLDTYALCGSLTACSSVKNVIFGKQIHAHVAKLGWSCSVFVGSALVDVYVKLLYIRDASNVFDEIPEKNTVCANALLSGFCECKLWVEGLRLVQKLSMLNLNYDSITLSAVLRVCVGLSAVELGRQAHGYVFRTILHVENDVFLQSSLIGMYGKFGSVEKALQVFSLKGIEGGRKGKRDVVLWTSMLGVYGRNGLVEKAIGFFKEMLMEGIRPDGVAFLAVLSACSHTGNLQLGLKYFESMTHDYRLDPGAEHYSCLVDLFCRAGQLEKAWKLVNQVSCKGDDNCNVSMWGALLNACAEYGSIGLGRVAARRALELNPQNVGMYVLLSNLYARLGMWDELEQLRFLVKERGLKKGLASSWIEISG